MSDVDINVDELLALSKALKGWDNELRKELHKGLRDAAKPLIPVVREALRQTYPKRGGLNERMAKAKIRTQFRTGRDAGISFVVTGLQIRLGEQYGTIRHPVFPDTSKPRREWTWVAQQLETGAIKRAVDDNLELVVPGVTATLEMVTGRALGRFKGGGGE
jgi:hypothetical protein